MKVTVETIATASGVDTDVARLFEAHAAQLLRYCACRVGRDTAEDLVAQIFLVAVSGGAVYDPTRGSELTWLYGIATRLIRSHRRAESRRLAGFARMAEPEVVAEFTDQADGRIDAVAKHRRVARAMARLPARQRDVLLLVAVTELEYAEIAAVLDIPIGSVRSALHRARAKVRAALTTEDSNG